MSENNEQTSQQSTLPGENAMVNAAGETIGENYSEFKATSRADFEIQLLDFARSALEKGYEVQGYRVPAFDTVMGKDSQIVGAVAGGTSDERTDFKDVIVNFDSTNTPNGIPVQVRVRRLSDQKLSAWVSIDQVLNNTAIPV